MGRLFNGSELQRLGEITELSLETFTFQNESMPAEIGAVLNTLRQEDQLIVQPHDNVSILGYITLKDIFGQPAVILRIDMPKDLYRQGKNTVNYLIIFILITGTIFGLITFLILEKTVLNRIDKFSDSIEKISQSRDLSSRIDISGNDEIAKFGETINSMMAQLEKSEKKQILTESLHALGEMAAGISHNLNNILVGIMVGTELLKKAVNDPVLLERIEQIHASGLRAQDLVSRLQLTFRGGDEEAEGFTLVNPVIHEAIKATQPKWKDGPEARGITIAIKLELTEERYPVRATSSGLFNIIMNLIFNAVDAMPEGGTIIIRTSHVDDGIQIVTKDSGRGMDAETRKQAFEPFFTTKLELGTGLGLSTVNSSINRWGGTVDLESETNKGTSITLWLPKAKGGKPKSEVKIELPKVRRAKILVIDDQEDVGSLISIMLRDKHEVSNASNGKDAIASITDHEFDVALIDLGMPGIPGDQIANEIRLINPSVATILMTGWQIREDDQRLSKFDFHLHKPLNDLDEVHYVVALAVQLCDQRRAKPD